jgi:hypothetical protein
MSLEPLINLKEPYYSSYYPIMTALKILLLTILISVPSFADTEPQPELKVGDCFNYTDGTVRPDVFFMIARAETFSFSDFTFQGTLFVKTKVKSGKVKIKDFRFELPFEKRNKYQRVSCPKGIPKLK